MHSIIPIGYKYCNIVSITETTNATTGRDWYEIIGSDNHVGNIK